jgi:hypothetical protein
MIEPAGKLGWYSTYSRFAFRSLDDVSRRKCEKPLLPLGTNPRSSVDRQNLTY